MWRQKQKLRCHSRSERTPANHPKLGVRPGTDSPSGPSEDINPAYIFVSDSWPPELWDNKLLIFNPPSLWNCYGGLSKLMLWRGNWGPEWVWSPWVSVSLTTILFPWSCRNCFPLPRGLEKSWSPSAGLTSALLRPNAWAGEENKREQLQRCSPCSSPGVGQSWMVFRAKENIGGGWRRVKIIFPLQKAGTPRSSLSLPQQTGE